MNVDLAESTQFIYLENLIPLRPKWLQQAVNETIRTWDRSRHMPPVAEILRQYNLVAFWENHNRELAKTKEILSRPDKPPSMDDLRVKANVTHEEMLQWLEEGKRKQREHIARLEADPEWREMAQRLSGVTGLRLPKTQVPVDPIERKKWAHDQAIRQGYLPREAGCDDE